MHVSPDSTCTSGNKLELHSRLRDRAGHSPDVDHAPNVGVEPDLCTLAGLEGGGGGGGGRPCKIYTRLKKNLPFILQNHSQNVACRIAGIFSG